MSFKQSVITLILFLSAVGIFAVTGANETQVGNCDDLHSIYSRVKCGLDTPEINDTGFVKEACQGFGDGCIEMYDSSEKCYKITGSAKDQCLQEEAGIEGYYGATDEQMREYIILLLYDLQKVVEHQIENKYITSADAATLTTSIIILSQDIMHDSPKQKIQKSMENLWTSWEEII